MDPAKLFGIIIAALGALNFVFGFLPQVTASRIDESLSVYAVGPGYVPILLLIAGILALAGFLPGRERYRLAVVALSLGGAAGALISLGTSTSLEVLAAGQVSKGLGAVLLTIFGIIQAVVAIAAYVIGTDLRVGSGSRPAGERLSGSQNPPVQHGWMAADPAPAWSPPAPDPSAPPHPGPTPTPEPTGSVGYYSGYAPAPGGATGLGRAAAPSPAMSNWEPPADDDRPTGPQPVVDPADRQSPGERELPRVAPDQPTGPAQPVELTKQSDPSPDIRSRHAAGDDRTGPAATPTPTRTPTPTGPPSSGSDDGVTEVYRIPPRTGPDGPAGS